MKEEEEVKKRFNFVKLIIILLILYIIGYNIYKIVISPINNIYIENNKYLSDQEVIDASGIRDYPSFMLTFKYSINPIIVANNPIIQNIAKNIPCNLSCFSLFP